MSKIQTYRILIFTQDPEKLAQFYKNALGFKKELSLDIPNDRGVLLRVNEELKLWVGFHSQVHGYAQEPFRHIFNLHVTSVTEWYKKIKTIPGIKIICPVVESPISTPAKPDYVQTWLDPEGNCWQFRGPR